MSVISDNQRRLICRLAFLALCLAPTLVTVYQIAHPQTANDWELALRAELGVDTKISSVETPNPGEVILRDLRFLDGDQLLFQTVEARIVYGKVNRIVIEYPVSKLDSVGIWNLASRMNQQWLQRPDKLEHIWRIEFKDEVVIDRAQQARDVPHDSAMQLAFDIQQSEQLVLSKNARIDLAPTSEGLALTAYFQVKNQHNANFAGAEQSIGASYSDTMLFKINSYGQIQDMDLETRSGRLPVWLLDGIRPELSAALGRDATFSGQLKLVPSKMQVAHLSGVFEQVDVSRFPGLAQDSAHATVEIRDCRFHEGRFEKWVVNLNSPNILSTPIDQRHLFRPSKQFAFLPALEKAVQRGLQ